MAIAAVVIIAAGVGGWWFFIRDDAPAETSADVARETLDEQAAAGDAAVDGTSDGSIEGTWSLDSSIGSFDYAAEDFSGTWAGYRIQEELAGIGGQEAVGRTPNVTGTITIAGNQVTEGSFEVDMTTLESDQDMRDNAMGDRGLQTGSFPTATFTVTEPIDLPDDATSGSEVTVSAAGELTLHGVTNPVTLELITQFADGAVAINGSTEIALADYDIEKPTNQRVLSIADTGTLEFQLFLTQE